jgi:hypothetical protein
MLASRPASARINSGSPLSFIRASVRCIRTTRNTDERRSWFSCRSGRRQPQVVRTVRPGRVAASSRPPVARYSPAETRPPATMAKGYPRPSMTASGRLPPRGDRSRQIGASVLAPLGVRPGCSPGRPGRRPGSGDHLHRQVAGAEDRRVPARRGPALARNLAGSLTDQPALQQAERAAAAPSRPGNPALAGGRSISRRRSAPRPTRRRQRRPDGAAPTDQDRVETVDGEAAPSSPAGMRRSPRARRRPEAAALSIPRAIRSRLSQPGRTESVPSTQPQCNTERPIASRSRRADR